MGVRRRPLRAATPRVLDPVRARAVAFDLLSRRAWTHQDLLGRLCRRGAPAEVAAAVVADLEARGYVDDRSYAFAWAESRARGRALGSRRLREELLAHGVDRALADEAVGEVAGGEEARAREAAARRLAGLRRTGPESAARRLHGFLSRRGFPPDVVRRVVRATCGVATLDGGDE